MIKINFKDIPNQPGIYKFKNKYNKVIYIGKSKNLKSRITQYKNGSINSFKTIKMMKEATKLEYLITNNNKEAFILERNLIKEYKPIYNIQLLDDKRYPYIKVKLGKDLKISVVRKTSKDKAFYFGPFPVGNNYKSLLHLAERVGLYKDGLPIKSNDKNFWREKYEEVKKIFTQENRKLIKKLEEKMMYASSIEMFELAQEYKKMIFAIKIFNQEKQSVSINETKNVDVYGVDLTNDICFISILFYRSGDLLSIQNHSVDIVNSVDETINEFINRFYEQHPLPYQILISNKIVEKLDIDTNVINPKKGILKEVLNLATKNSEDNKDKKLHEHKLKYELSIGAITKLGKLLNIEIPNTIAMIDCSNIANKNPVSAMIFYKNGIKDKSNYRKFNLEVGSRKSDVDYMKQTILRYFDKTKLNLIPDILFVDGGLAQVNEVKKVLKSLDINLKIIGLVKNDKHITRAIVDENGLQIEIEDRHLLNFLRGVQEEVDRFAKQQLRSRSLKGTLEGTLSQIEGVGTKTAEKLLSHFSSYSAIYNATIEQLEKIVPKKTAINIKKVYK
ncbi:MAG: GIY-YIG nuclease family protein [Mycoplasma sp.]|nr:GIY-YIG nuclease family protein [Mycoplasma sp.]